MREVTRKAVDAFLAGKPAKVNNTEVQVRPWQSEKINSVILLLHGNPIARYHKDTRQLFICDGNHQSNVTKERLNGLPGVRVNQRDWQWYLDGKKWDGAWTHVGFL